MATCEVQVTPGHHCIPPGRSLVTVTKARERGRALAHPVEVRHGAVGEALGGPSAGMFHKSTIKGLSWGVTGRLAGNDKALGQAGLQDRGDLTHPYASLIQRPSDSQ